MRQEPLVCCQGAVVDEVGGVGWVAADNCVWQSHRRLRHSVTSHQSGLTPHDMT